MIDSKKWLEDYSTNYEKTFLIFITDLCNLRCSYCFNKGNLKSNKTSCSGSMDIDYVERIIKANPDVNKYDIMGGEPLFHHQFDEIVKLLMKHNKKIGLYTNGFLLKDRLRDNYNNFRINISFQSISNDDKSLKPIGDFSIGIKKFQKIYPFKLVLLLNNQNKHQLLEIARYIEDSFSEIDKLTIGAVRNEEDYWNDNYDYVVPFSEYGEIIQNFIDKYDGRLNIDVFTKGYLYTDLMPRNKENQLGRFKCLFPRNKLVPSLYGIARKEEFYFDPDKAIDFADPGYSTVDGREWTDKIRLTRKK